MRQHRWMKALAGLTVAAGLVRQSNCVIDLPNSIVVDRPIVVDDNNDDDDDGDCFAIDCD